ncbi:PadR family transcriptional regulator [Candidatus Micrarchaeota archaeon]|nr:PadR family transcriptional regulator [Candidatus Micrarchaeota archaeon]
MSNLNILDLMVLWQISLEPTHGYSLLKTISEKRGRKMTAGSLIPMLKKFQKNKLIKVKRRGKREKIVYEITPKGRKILNSSGRDFVVLFEDIFNRFLCTKCKGRLEK